MQLAEALPRMWIFRPSHMSQPLPAKIPLSILLKIITDPVSTTRELP